MHSIPPNGMTHTCKADPFGRFACLVPIFNARGQKFCKYFLLQKLPTSKTNHPEYSLLEFLPVQRNTLPYNRPDWNEIPADKESARRFKYPAEGTNISSKMPHQMSLFTKHHKYIKRQEKQVKVNSNKKYHSPPPSKNKRSRFNQTSWQTLIYFSTQVKVRKNAA